MLTKCNCSSGPGCFAMPCYDTDKDPRGEDFIGCANKTASGRTCQVNACSKCSNIRNIRNFQNVQNVQMFKMFKIIKCSKFSNCSKCSNVQIFKRSGRWIFDRTNFIVCLFRLGAPQAPTSMGWPVWKSTETIVGTLTTTPLPGMSHLIDCLVLENWFLLV